ncbi:MAG: hypothetical protein WBC44_14840 [Planctomycetaceae bacterium]
MHETHAHDRPTTYAAGQSGVPQPCQDLAKSLREYARERPEVAALWCLGIGFVLGWKLKPW